jgi:lipopolysaccharide/colanic/teichoic acid biosynthesis glycosyltransferase
MKRTFDVLTSLIGLVMIAPLFVFLALAIVVESGAPIFFSQTRVGRYGKAFKILKFRTMRVNQPGSSITVAGDRRITRFGGFLRGSKLDELPQLWNVLRGEMSIVGPRPEIPCFVSEYPEQYALLLTVRPGIVDPASIAFHDEADRLAGYADPSHAYLTSILPAKLALSKCYLNTRTWLTDFGLILRALGLIGKSLFR